MKKALFAFFLLFAQPAHAGVSCTLPFTLTNGTIADANQVMANYNALVTCIGNAAAAGVNTDITSLLGLTTPITPTQGGTPTYIGSDSIGTSTALAVVSTTPSGFSLAPGLQVLFKAGVTTAGDSTLNVNGTGDVQINKQTATGLQPLTGSEIFAGQVYAVFYDGTVWQLLNPSAASAILPPQAITAIYTVAPTDCSTTLSLGGGTFFPVAFPDPAGFSSGCVVNLIDSDARGRGVLLFGGTPTRLLPLQSLTVTQVAGTWVVSPQSQLWSTPSTFYVNNVSGSDDPSISDCLAPGVGACKTFQKAVDLAQTLTLPPPGGNTIQADCESAFYTQAALGSANSIQVFRGLGGIINFVGNSSTPANCAITPSISTTIFDVQDGQQATIVGFALGFGGSGGIAVNGRQLVITDVTNSLFASNIGGVHVNAMDLASVNLTNVSLNGNATTFVLASNKAAVQVNGVSVPAAGAAAITIWFDATDAEIAGIPAYAIAGSATGISYACNNNAVINLATAYPGTLSPGTASTGCQATPP